MFWLYKMYLPLEIILNVWIIPLSIRSNNSCVKMLALCFVQYTSLTQRYILGIEVNVGVPQSQHINNTGDL